jgi:uncharacterized membrane protein YhhN
MKKSLLHLLFIVIVLGVLTGEYLKLPLIDHIFKPLIMLWIGGYFYLYSKGIDKTVVRMALSAFIASWAGDLFMMFADQFIYFVMGIASFLTAQVFYVFLFLRTINLSGKKSFLKKKPVWLIAYIAYGIVIYIILFPHLDGVLKPAVLIYVLAILSMSSMALNRLENGHPKSFTLVFAGSLFFVASDSMIAINRFLVPIPYEGLLIMSTYIGAQYLIMRGILMQYE